ncbi:08b9ccab-bc2e-4f15-915f-80be2863104d [Thermothielavioides terrestris]|uniref:Telomerase reverse transcriptase n=1 Tax=Thermothielavioides terrestris TaxID=2587410 RepID=A0A3S4AID9_9PEZI|nr:08b9ccab-bc2e-4f15-915f-80be2863104d [Thermothielavioides terrestris]
MSLHEVMQGMKISEIEWLAPPGLGNQKSSLSDTRKRAEIFYEFLYYLFDSFLIPLIRNNFYVTESAVDRYRLFFFRHDIWRYVAEPAMASLKARVLDEVKKEDAPQLDQLGYSQVRLLPKQNSMRPIMNLRRRTLVRDKKILGPSINTKLAPVSSMLKLEKSRNPNLLGSSLFSVGDLYQRIKGFKRRLGGGQQHDLYFAKVDVQAAFDTIPQDAMIELLKQIPSHSEYNMVKHVEMSLLDEASGSGSKPKPTKRWHTVVRATNDRRSFAEWAEESLAAKKKNTIFVNGAVQEKVCTRHLLALTAMHIGQNLVRIGKKYYRQKTGIPQGSVLSSTLCNYFYADLERKHLSFLQADDCLLLRLIDDFILITTDQNKARRFVDVMLGGLPDYGVTVNPEKSLVNFALTVRGSAVPRPHDSQKFPYCGLLIDCKTLAVTKQRDGSQGRAIFDSLTVEYSRRPGRNFKRKVINAFKIQSHLMFFDTAHNSRRTVLGNVYSAFAETAAKMWAYARCMAAGRPGPRVLVDTIKTLVDVAFVLLTSRARRERYPGYVCCLRKVEVAWLAMVACRQVLVRKQTGYGEVIAWLEGETRKLSGQKGLDVETLVEVAKALPAHKLLGDRRV